jgi:hypothetical protein
LLFPYLEGAGFVLRLWQARPERGAPFGPDLPASTEQVLHPERFLSDPPDAPTTVRITVADGARVLDDVLGQAEVAVMLAEVAEASPGAAAGWDGDRWVLVEPPGGGPALLAWASVWDDEPARDRVAALLAPAANRFPGGATLEVLEVASRPALLLVVGGGLDVVVTLEEGGAS